MRITKSFQNISCYCLSNFYYIPISVYRISKHLMLLFIVIPKFASHLEYISKHLMLLFISFVSQPAIAIYYFKTSHVIVYLADRYHFNDFPLFQNISCYCLSHLTPKQKSVLVISKHLMLLFIKAGAAYINGYW